LSTADSLGNKGKMTAGDVQWMTAGSGILHQEMPKGDRHGRMHGFQLVGQPAVSAEDDRSALSGYSCQRDPRGSPTTTVPTVRIICGEFWGKKGRWRGWPPIRTIRYLGCPGQ